MTGTQRKAILATLTLLVIYQAQRLIFLLFNLDYFANSGIIDISLAFLHGIRFDISSIILLNIPFLLVCLVPYGSGSQKSIFTKWLFLTINIPAILLNTIDIEYFKFQGKRTGADLFELFLLGEDMQNTLPQMAKDFWTVILFASICSALLVMAFAYIERKTKENQTTFTLRSWSFTLLLAPVFFVGARGAIGLKPLRITNAASAVEPMLAPLVLNTPFTIIKTFGKQGIDIKFEMPLAEAKMHFNRFKTGDQPSTKKNVMIIILESFSAEYSQLLSGKPGYTPFLDSLMLESMYFTNAYANAKKSMDGIPAVTSSIPALMPVSFITSPYAANQVTSVAGLLKSNGYSSAFFHGGNNGTMGFDNFSKNSGYDNYFGRKEYGSSDYDGNWGVFDEPFYRFVINKCDQTPEPFVGTVFSLSSHHPYSIPDELKNKFPKGSLPIHESIGYADYALRIFFNEASKTKWYQNTLFVITADHTGPAETPAFGNRHGAFRIPLFYFNPDKSLQGASDRTTQQADILPTIMDLIGFKGSWLDFGTSALDSTESGFAVTGTGDSYQIISGGKMIQFDGSKTVGAYEIRTDTLLKKNLVPLENQEWFEIENKLKSILIQYAAAMRENQIVIKP